MDAQECFRIGLANRVVEHDKLLNEAYGLARELKSGPLTALGITKDALEREADMDLVHALEVEAMEQARCMNRRISQKAIGRSSKSARPNSINPKVIESMLPFFEQDHLLLRARARE